MELIITPDNILRSAERTSFNRIPSTFDWEIWGSLGSKMIYLRDTPGIHRRSWEYAMCLLGQEALHPLESTSKVLATGAGTERPIYHYANTTALMHATDLYDASHDEGRPSMLSDPDPYAPFPYRREALRVSRMNACSLDLPDEEFDFSFCLSSIEHFGTRQEQRRAFHEMIRTTRRGGLICIVTEIILNDRPHSEFFLPREINGVFGNIESVEMIGGEFDLRVQESLLAYPVHTADRVGSNRSPHLFITDGDVIWTSLSMFFRRVG